MSHLGLLCHGLLFAILIATAVGQANDTDALFRFQLQVDAHAVLATNWSVGSGDACSAAWWGVRCSSGRVIAISLPSMNLRGPITSLAALDQLRLLDLRDNRLNGSLLTFAKCTNLKLLYLSGNDFSGEVPEEMGGLRRLLRLDLSDNNLSGPLPAGLTKLTRLITLHLQNNALFGELPDFSTAMPGLTEFNISNNELSGNVADGLQRKFGNEILAGNEGLCGPSPFPACTFTDSLSLPPSSADVVPSNPSSMPGSAIAIGRQRSEDGGEERKRTLSTPVVVAIVVADGIVLVIISSFLLAYLCGRGRRASQDGVTNKGGMSSASSTATEGKKGEEGSEAGGRGRSKLVFYGGKRDFELEELLRASAEMLGKGSVGTVYRAVLEDGGTVAVKRLKDANPCERKEFERYMDVIGKLRQQNLVRLRAYYYAKEEKLLVYDYLPSGSLHSLLHGNRDIPGRSPLDWTTRLSIVLGAARGLARIHTEHSVTKIPHGNIKSTNVLLDRRGTACIADFGLALLLSPGLATARLGGYRAPEQADGRSSISQKADIYAFGVLLLEVLTGRAPGPASRRVADGEEEDLARWVRGRVSGEWQAELFDPELLRYKRIKGELGAVLRLGLACAAEDPEARPSMEEVVRTIEEIHVEKSPLGEEDDDLDEVATVTTTTDDAF